MNNSKPGNKLDPALKAIIGDAELDRQCDLAMEKDQTNDKTWQIFIDIEPKPK
jgi:hypothetical protein